MNSTDTRIEELLAELREQYARRDADATRISRRKLLRSTMGNAVVAAVGLDMLVELLENREAFAAGQVIAISGVTREPDQSDETAHRHTFGVRFDVGSVSPSGISGMVSGRTEAVISTSSTREDQHYHIIPSQ